MRWTQLQFGLPDDNPSNPDGYCTYLEPGLDRMFDHELFELKSWNFYTSHATGRLFQEYFRFQEQSVEPWVVRHRKKRIGLIVLYY